MVSACILISRKSKWQILCFLLLNIFYSKWMRSKKKRIMTKDSCQNDYFPRLVFCYFYVCRVYPKIVTRSFYHFIFAHFKMRFLLLNDSKKNIFLLNNLLFRIMFDKNHVVILGIDLWEHGLYRHNNDYNFICFFFFSIIYFFFLQCFLTKYSSAW